MFQKYRHVAYYIFTKKSIIHAVHAVFPKKVKKTVICLQQLKVQVPVNSELGDKPRQAVVGH